MDSSIPFSFTSYSKWDENDFKLPSINGNLDYGVNWPAGTTQIAKELQGFKYCRENKPLPGSISTFDHFLKIIQILFPHKVDLFKDVKKGGVYLGSGRIWNNYCLDVAKKLCTGKSRKKALAGPASANKTYIVALFAYCCFLSAPKETTVMVSTTSGQGSERRIWGSIKEFHEEGRFEEAGMQRPGTVIEHLKCIVYDEGKEIGGADKNQRDYRNGMMVVPIARDSSGETALSTIQGTKNRHVIWIVDELAQMPEGVTRPIRNLMANLFFLFIGIGNSASSNDPHGQLCMPENKLDGLNVLVDREWTSANGTDVLFLHGDESPNNHPLIDQSKITGPSDYPFGYATNPFNNNELAIDCGHGDSEAGKKTTDYWKFAIGFWAPTDATNSLFTDSLARAYQADQPAEMIMYGERAFGGGDFAFSVGGDDNTLYVVRFGITSAGKRQLTFSKETISIKVPATSKQEFNEMVAGEFVKQIKANNIEYSDFGADVGNDAAITLNAMSRIANTHDFVGISSVGAAYVKEKYKNRVTELYFDARDVIRTGICRGINLKSKYWTQLCERRYESINKGFYQIEPKPKMKERIHRSPDDADAFIYAMHMVKRSGLIDDELQRVRQIALDTEYNQANGYHEVSSDPRRAAYSPLTEIRNRNSNSEGESDFVGWSSKSDDYGDEQGGAGSYDDCF